LENNADQIASVNKHRESEEYKVALEKRKEEEKREAEERKIRAEKRRQEEEQDREEREREQERREQQKAEEKKKRVISILAHIVAFIVNPCFIFISGNGYCILFSIIYSIVFLITSFKDYYEKCQYKGKNISNLKHLVIYSIIGLIAFIAIHCFL
jgi:cation transport ATPase